MKFLDEYRQKILIDIIVRKINDTAKGNWRIMEVCGSQTHTILKYNLEELLPDNIELIHGPGCPVCVTPAEIIDRAISLTSDRNVILATYGDMLRVPGTNESLLSVKKGDNIQIIYSPLDAVKLAEENPHRTIIFLAIGFETTSPGNAHAIMSAAKKNLNNFFVLSAQVLIPPAIRYILGRGNSKVQGLLAPGHVCAITGFSAYEQISGNYKIPVAITGFEPLDILEGIYILLQHLEMGTWGVVNEYVRVVKKEGNLRAINDMFEVFEVTDFNWRGIGIIENSGLKLRKKYNSMNADLFFNTDAYIPVIPNECIAGEIMQGLKKPSQCNYFGSLCNPENPIGAPMVSAEGICAAYFRYKNIRVNND